MIAALTVLLLGVVDPRVEVASLQLEERHAEALNAVESALGDDPDSARALGFDYLKGHLLELLGRPSEAQRAFAAALESAPQLAAYSRYRLASSQYRLGHPEVAAGLLATLLGGRPPQPLMAPASRMLVEAVARGGDCRLLVHLDSWILPVAEKRSLQVARAECALRQGEPESAGEMLIRLLREEMGDDSARVAAERIDTTLVQVAGRAEVARILGRTFYRHRRFELSTLYLKRGLGLDGGTLGELRTAEDFEALYALGRSNFWRGDYILAASYFGRLAASSGRAEEKARALYQQGRCYELSGSWDAATKSYRLAYLAAPQGRWSDAALFSALRLEWRLGTERQALELYELLGTRRSWLGMRSRAALFLAASDLVRERTDRAGAWLDQAARSGGEARLEVDYWRGRLAEARDDPRALDFYLEALLRDPYHPLGHEAALRLRQPPLEAAAQGRGRALARSARIRDLTAAWLLLGEGDESGTAARDRLRSRLTREASAAPFLDLEPVPPAGWPIWTSKLSQPEETLLALGIWGQGSTVVLKHFPVTEPALAFTGSLLLARAEQASRSLYVAEILSQRVPPELPAGLIAPGLRRLLHPFPWRQPISREAVRQGIDPFLLAALIREESRFNPQAVSAASARGLAQFVLPTASRLAAGMGLESLRSEDLHDPELSIALGAAYLAELSERFEGRVPVMLAAYNAGENQALLWQSYCYSREPAEFLTKVGFPETRSYLRRVLTSRSLYAELYAD